MLEEGPTGFIGGMSAKKYMAITKTSKATATRDLQDLAEKNAIVLYGNGEDEAPNTSESITGFRGC